MVALPRHLVALFLKIVTFNNVLMVLKIVTLLYNGRVCFFNGDRFEVINSTLLFKSQVSLVNHVNNFKTPITTRARSGLNFVNCIGSKSRYY